MRCGYLTFQEAENDANTWSGLNYNIRQALCQAGFEVEHLGGLAQKSPWSVRVKGWYYKYLVKQGFDPNRDPAFLRKMGRLTAQRIRAHRSFDFLFAPSSYPISRLDLRIPKFVWLDATFAGMIDYYPDFKGLSSATIKAGIATESEALGQCAGVFFASEWAAESALREYNLAQERVHVVPFGANMKSPFASAGEARASIQQRRTPPYEFLFMGVDWHRKGGEFAVEVIRSLNALGFPARLTVVGCVPALSDTDLEFTRVIGFLDKTNPDQQSRLNELLLSSHFFILPTRAEAYGLVFAEAAAFALPSLAFQTGGVPTIVKNGETGLLFQAEENPAMWAEKIGQLLQTPDRYTAMASAAYLRYAQVLNWNVAATHARQIILKSLG